MLQKIEQLQQLQQTQLGSSQAVRDIPVVELASINASESLVKTLAFKGGLRDPFSKTQAIHDFLQQDNSAAANNQPSESNFAMQVTAIVNPGKNKALLAVIEIAGVDSYMVQAGDQISFNVNNNVNNLRVKAVNRLDVEVELNSKNNRLTLRQ